MYRFSKMRFIFPVGLLIFFFLDGSLSNVLGNVYFKYPYSMVSHLTVLWLVFGVLFQNRGQNAIPVTVFAAIAGGLFDIYYSGIFGVFVFIYPLIVMLTRVMARYFTPNFFSSIMIFFVDIALLEFLNYLAYSVVGMANANLSDFLLDALAPTLALNLIYYVILYYPIFRLYERFDIIRS